MNRSKSGPGSPRAAAGALLLAAGAALVGCVHKPYIQQGNYLETKDIDQVTEGMTRSQVRYVLGTPMISDPFTAQRWDYIYTLKRGRQRKIDRAHFVVYFADDKVARVERLDTPEPSGGGIETGLPEVQRTDEEIAAKAAERDKGEKEEKDREPTPEPPRPEG